jgi:hypothetical protein
LAVINDNVERIEGRVIIISVSRFVQLLLAAASVDNSILIEIKNDGGRYLFRILTFISGRGKDQGFKTPPAINRRAWEAPTLFESIEEETFVPVLPSFTILPSFENENTPERERPITDGSSYINGSSGWNRQPNPSTFRREITPLEEGSFFYAVKRMDGSLIRVRKTQVW